MNKLILFDFDGTVADTFYLSRKVINDHAEELGFKQLTEKEIEKLRDMTAQEIFSYVKIPLYRLPQLIRLYHREMSKVITQAEFIPGMREVLGELKERGYVLGVVSSSKKENIEKFLNEHTCTLFDFVYSKFNIFGKHETIREILRNNRIAPGETVYVGDEVRDIEAARKAGVLSVAVTWGFNTKKLLEKHNPNYLVEEPRQILRVVTA